jgi:hypothetical protein
MFCDLCRFAHNQTDDRHSAAEPPSWVVGYFEFSRPGEMEATSMAMDQELRIATASNDSIPAATKVSPRWGQGGTGHRPIQRARRPQMEKSRKQAGQIVR